MSHGRAEPAPILERVLAAGPPLDLTPWALGRAALEYVLERVAAGQRRIVECGSGISTIAISRLLRELGDGHLWSLEHDPSWAALARERLVAEAIDDRATVIDAPLRPHAIAPAAGGWYDTAALKALPAGGVDLLLIDGPPAPSDQPDNQRSRYPALPLLAGRLAPRATIVLDDAQRAGERWAMERWQEDLQIGFEPRPGRFAVATLGSTAATETPPSGRAGRVES